MEQWTQMVWNALCSQAIQDPDGQFLLGLYELYFVIPIWDVSRREVEPSLNSSYDDLGQGIKTG